MIKLITKYFRSFEWTYQLSFLLLVSTLILMILGSLVRLTHSGLSCPDWPLCYGMWLIIPSKIAIVENDISYEYSQIIFEWTHRIFAICIILMLALLSVANSIYQYKIYKNKFHLLFICIYIYLFFVLFIQIMLGSLTVIEQNVNWSVALHLLNALLFYNGVVMIYCVIKNKNLSLIKYKKTNLILNTSIMLLFYFNMTLGVMISVSGVKFINNIELYKLLNDPFLLIYNLHFISSIMIGIAIGIYYLYNSKDKLLNYIILLLSINIFVGILSINYDNNMLIKIIHQIISLFIFTLYSYFYWKTINFEKD